METPINAGLEMKSPEDGPWRYPVSVTLLCVLDAGLAMKWKISSPSSGKSDRGRLQFEKICLCSVCAEPKRDNIIAPCNCSMESVLTGLRHLLYILTQIRHVCVPLLCVGGVL